MKIVWNDILKERVDAIVTPASRNPQIGTGLPLEQLTGDGSFKDMFRRLWEYTMRREKATRARAWKRVAVERARFWYNRDQS